MFVIFCQVDKLITVCIWTMNNAGRCFLYVCEYVIVQYFTDCDDELKFT